VRKLTVKLQRSPDDIVTVGTLAEQDRRTYFEYAPDFLDTGLQLSPFRLPLRAGLMEHADRSFGPLPGLFDDSLPDGWGLLLMDRHFRGQGLDPTTLSPLDRLAYLGTRTMGALTYHPPVKVERDERLLDLYELGRNAENVLAGSAARMLPALARAGGSAGGARPKVLVGIRGNQIISGENDLTEGAEHWMVKFAAKADARDAGPVEYAYSLMARAAGIDRPETRLFEVKHGRSVRRYFAVRRFDRATGNRRMHVHTFANLIHANFRIPSTDYADLFKVTRSLTRNHRDLLRLFRLMVFNVAAHNRDDHAKNFAFMLDDRTGEWSLAPAYDLTHAPGPGGEHSTTLLGEGRQPTAAHCLKLAEQAGIQPRELRPITDEVNAAIGRWRSFARQAECEKKITAAIARAIRPL
jgi:serine/threonine-protein kinase HipA